MTQSGWYDINSTIANTINRKDQLLSILDTDGLSINTRSLCVVAPFQLNAIQFDIEAFGDALSQMQPDDVDITMEQVAEDDALAMRWLAAMYLYGATEGDEYIMTVQLTQPIEFDMLKLLLFRWFKPYCKTDCIITFDLTINDDETDNGGGTASFPINIHRFTL